MQVSIIKRLAISEVVLRGMSARAHATCAIGTYTRAPSNGFALLYSTMKAHSRYF